MTRLAAAVFMPLACVCGFGSTLTDASAAPPDPAAPEKEMCAASHCQRDVRVTLKREDGTLYQGRFKVWPATVQDMGIIVMAGQTVYVEADVSGNRLVNLVAVERVTHPEKTISAKLEQNAEGGMLLEVRNPFSQSLKFNMGMMPLKTERLAKTSSCPVRGGLFLIEHWPFPIFQLVLGNARLLEADASMACVD